MDFFEMYAAQFVQFLLVFSRVTGTLASAPIFGSRVIPTIARIGLAVLLSLCVFPMTTLPPDRQPSSLLVLFWWVLIELIYGLTAGYVASLFFNSVQMAGQLIDMQIGFGIVNVFDPQFGQQVPLIGNFKYLMAISVFLALQGHHILIGALADNFRSVPLGVQIYLSDATPFMVDCRDQPLCNGSAHSSADTRHHTHDGCCAGNPCPDHATDECFRCRYYRQADRRNFYVVFDSAFLCFVSGGRL